MLTHSPTIFDFEANSTPRHKPYTSVKAINRSVAQYLPQHYEPVCQSLFQFVKLLLNPEEEGPPYPAPPNEDQISIIASIGLDGTQGPEIIDDDQLDASDVLGKTKKIPRRFLEFVNREIQGLGIQQISFQWDQKVETQWDTLVINVIVKHWLFARSKGAFQDYALNPEFCTKEILFGILSRWLRGQKEKYGKVKDKTPAFKVKIHSKVS